MNYDSYKHEVDSKIGNRCKKCALVSFIFYRSCGETVHVTQPRTRPTARTARRNNSVTKDAFPCLIINWSLDLEQQHGATSLRKLGFSYDIWQPFLRHLTTRLVHARCLCTSVEYTKNAVFFHVGSASIPFLIS